MRSTWRLRALAATGCGVAMLAVGAASAADPPAAQLPVPQVDGRVHAVAISGSTAYLGGEFNSAASPGEPFQVGHFVQVDPATGTPQRSIGPFLGGGGGAWVTHVVPDGSGGWFVSGRLIIDGRFTELGHVKADGSPDKDWRVDLTSGPVVMAVAGSTLYVGGIFTSINGVPRRYIAALDVATGAVKPFDPGLDNSVNSMVVDGSTLYVGGRFATVNNGATVRSRIAAFDTTTGTLTSFNPGIDTTGVVLALAASGGRLYAGGFFSFVNGSTPRHHLAAFDLATGVATPFNPEPDQEVQDLAVSGSTVYAGGFFTHARGTARNHLAAFDATTGALTPFDPNVNTTVATVAVSGNTVYAGGGFSAVNGGVPREFLAAFSAGDGTVLPAFDAHVNDAPFQGSVMDMALSGSSLYIAGGFPSVGGVHRHDLLAFDLATGKLTSFDPNADDEVHALAVSGSTLYVGGRFTHVNGTIPRRGMAAFDTATGTATPFDPNVAPDVEAIAVVGSTVYAGGDFKTVKGTAHPNLASFDAATGAENGLAPAADGYVGDLAASGGTVYVGGGFTHLGSMSRNHLGAFDTTGAVTPFDPSLDGVVDALALNGSTVYAGGSFATVNGSTPRANLAAFDTTGAVTPFDAKLDATGDVLDLAAAGDALYAAGQFSRGTDTRNLEAFRLTDGAPTGWNASVDAYVRSIAAADSTLVAGGDARNAPFLSAFALPAAKPKNLAPTPDFESNPLPYWSPNGPCPATVRSTPQAHSSSHVLELASTTATLCRWLSNVDAIPVDPLAQYDVSAWLKSTGTNVNARISVNFWTFDHQYVPATVDGPLLLGTQDWTRTTVHVTAPRAAAFMRVEIRLNGPGTLWADDVDVEQAAAAPPEPANLAPDPDFELDPTPFYYGVGTGTFSWTGHALQLVTTQPSSSTARWLSKTTAIQVTPGHTYTASARLKTQNVTAGNAHLAVTFWDSSQNAIATVDSPTALTGSTDWTTGSVTTRAPSGAAYMRLELRLSGPGTLWVDDVAVAH